MIRHGKAGEVRNGVVGRVGAVHDSARQAWKGESMDWKKQWDEMDVIFADDTPIPEGKEQISEKDFDRILQESEDE